MKPIIEFPYGNGIGTLNPMHEKLLLLQTKIKSGPALALGYYDADHDVFTVCLSGFANTSKYEYYIRRPIGESRFKDLYCIVPHNFTQSLGPGCIKGYMPLDEAVADMFDDNWVNADIGRIFADPKYHVPYLVCLEDPLTCEKGCLIISEIEKIPREKDQFCTCIPFIINNHTYHTKRPVSRDMIRWTVNLEEWMVSKSE